MKTLKFFLPALLMILPTSCSDSKEPEQEQKVIYPLDLKDAGIRVCYNHPKDSIRIQRGNGGYEISLKSVEYTSEGYEHIPFLEHTTVFVRGKYIVAETILTDEFYTYALFEIEDSEGMKAGFSVGNTLLVGEISLRSKPILRALEIPDRN